MKITAEKIEKYINENCLEGKRIADVLREFADGHNKSMGDICFFHGYNVDMAMSHIMKIEKA